MSVVPRISSFCYLCSIILFITLDKIEVQWTVKSSKSCWACYLKAQNVFLSLHVSISDFDIKGCVHVDAKLYGIATVHTKMPNMALFSQYFFLALGVVQMD